MQTCLACLGQLHKNLWIFSIDKWHNFKNFFFPLGFIIKVNEREDGTIKNCLSTRRDIHVASILILICNHNKFKNGFPCGFYPPLHLSSLKPVRSNLFSEVIRHAPIPSWYLFISFVGATPPIHPLTAIFIRLSPNKKSPPIYLLFRIKFAKPIKAIADESPGKASSLWGSISRLGLHIFISLSPIPDLIVVFMVTHRIVIR